MSEKLHASSKEYSVDVLPSIPGDSDEGVPVRPIEPKILRRASLKIDLYLIPIIGMFRELYPLVSILTLPLTSPITRPIVLSSECRYDPSRANVQTVASL